VDNRLDRIDRRATGGMRFAFPPYRHKRL
jgi:hypothetical protein